MVAAAMGYALAKLSEDPGWLRTLNPSATLETALRSDAESFMKYRGRFQLDRIRAAAVPTPEGDTQ